MPTAGEPRRSEPGGEHRIRASSGAARRRLTFLLAVLVLGSTRVAAQEPRAPSAGGCNVTTGSPRVNADGEFVRPPVTPEDCAAAEALVDEFLEMSRGEFRRVEVLEDLPGTVSVYMGRMTPWGGSVDRLPMNGRRDVIWLSDRIVVVVVETTDIAGPTTTVVITNIGTRQVCRFERWPGSEGPQNLTVAEIQEVLDRGLSGNQPAPACRLDELPIEDLPIN